MAQPTLFSATGTTSESVFEYGTSVVRSRRVRRFSLGNGYEQVTPDGIQTDMRTYSLKTRPITDAEATSYDDFFEDLDGDFFYAQFPRDTALHKYRLEPNQWTWETLGPNSNRISFTVRRVYDSRS
jgi:phage-related protein